MRTADPFYDLARYEDECEDFESKCPVCDICGEPITDDYYYEVAGIKFHLDCADRRSVDSYVESQRNGY